MTKPFKTTARKRLRGDELIAITDASTCECGHSYGLHRLSVDETRHYCGHYGCTCSNFVRVVWCKCGHEFHNHGAQSGKCISGAEQCECTQFVTASWQKFHGDAP